MLSTSGSGGKRRAASPAEAETVGSLLSLSPSRATERILSLSTSSATERMLESALASVKRGDDMSTLETSIASLAGHLGTTRVERGTIAAIHAVLARIADPDRYPQDKDAYADKQIGARKQNYFQYKRLIMAVRAKEPDAKAQRTGSVRSSARAGGGCSVDDASVGATAAGHSSIARGSDRNTRLSTGAYLVMPPGDRADSSPELCASVTSSEEEYEQSRWHSQIDFDVCDAEVQDLMPQSVYGDISDLLDCIDEWYDGTWL
jgi:hypothetical protein